MRRLQEPRHGIPHEEFVRRKARLRQLDRQFDLVRMVPWPTWVGPVLLIVPFPVTGVLAGLAFGSAAALQFPLLLLVVLVISVAYAFVRDAIDSRRARRRGGPREPDEDVIEGPRLRFVLLTAAIVLPVLFVLLLALHGSVLGAVATLVQLVVLVSATAGAVITVSQLRARFRRSARRDAES